MVTYLALLLFIFVIYIFISRCMKQYDQDKRDRIFLWIVWIALSFLAGMRAYTVGADTATYARYFQKVNASHFEVGYKILCNLLKRFTSDPTVLFLICAMITNGLILYVFYAQSAYVLLSVYTYITLYYYFNSFNAMRQYVAVALIFFSYNLMIKNRKIVCWFFVILAALFHSTALVAGTILFILSRSKEKQAKNFIKFQVIIVGGILLFAFMDYFLKWFTAFIPQYRFYLMEGKEYLMASGGIQEILVYVSLFVLTILFIPKTHADLYPLKLIMCVVAVLSMISLKLAIAIRIIWYFDIYTTLAVPCIVLNGKSRRQRTVLFLVLCAASGGLMIYNLMLNKQRVGNYQFIFH